MFSSRTRRIINNVNAGVCENKIDVTRYTVSKDLRLSSDQDHYTKPQISDKNIIENETEIAINSCGFLKESTIRSVKQRPCMTDTKILDDQRDLINNTNISLQITPTNFQVEDTQLFNPDDNIFDYATDKNNIQYTTLENVAIEPTNENIWEHQYDPVSDQENNQQLGNMQDVSDSIIENRIATNFLERNNDLSPNVETYDKTSLESFSEDSDDSVKDADYVNSKPSSSSSSSCSTCSSDSSSNSSETKLRNAVKEGNEIAKNRGKKRKIGRDQWKRNLAKRLRNSGEEYKNSKTKKTFLKRQLRPPCAEKCKLKCFKKISEEERSNIFTKYWKLGDLQRQRDFIAASMTTVMPKYRYVREGSNRRQNNAFYFEISNKKIRVCKLFFKNTLSINDRPIRTVIEKKDLQHPQFLENDLRGKHQSHYKLDDELKESVRQHIQSIPRIPSHYCRANTSREFIEGGLTIAELHRHYKNSRQELGKAAANYVMYNKIFNDEFNISFFTPKKDQCEVCVSFQNSSEIEKEQMKENYESHLQQKELSRLEKQSDKESENFVAVYDLQAVLPCPKGNTSSFYYVSKLNVFNFTVYNIKTNAVMCYVWNEAQGNRGANEIGSCVLSYLENLDHTLDEPKNIIFYSDNCAGQQKNRFLLSMYIYAVKTFKNILSITHKYLTVGHTQNEGDNAHSLIERNVKRSLRSGPVYVPEQYVTLIRTAKKTGNPYNVQEMTFEDFYDLKSLAQSVGLGSIPQSLKISEVQIFKIKKEAPNKVFFKNSFDQEHFDEVEIGFKNVRGRKLDSSIFLLKAYKSKPGISENKKKSLLSLFAEKAYKSTAIPRCYKDYFNNL